MGANLTSQTITIEYSGVYKTQLYLLLAIDTMNNLGDSKLD